MPSAVVGLPVRPKRVDGVDRTAEERYDDLFAASTNTELHTGPGLKGTPDTVLLNAFDVAWHTNVQQTLTENVQPMLAYLDECAQLPTPPNVVIVSSAYVQPPAPHPPVPGLVPMELASDVETWYQALLTGTLDWDSLHTDAAGCHDHTVTNSYIFAKSLMEHLVLARYGDSMPITIVRPSNIGPSCDGHHGVHGTFGPQLFASVLQTPYFRFLLAGGGVDVVPVCGVADVIVDAVLNPGRSRFLFATCGNEAAISVQDFVHGVTVNPIQRVCFPPAASAVCATAQHAEVSAANLLHSPKIGAKLKSVYANYTVS